MAAWEDISTAKRAERDAAIPAAWRIAPPPDSVKNVLDVPRTCGVLTPDEIGITETPARALVASMLARRLSSEAVVTAFCKRAAVAQQLVNCLTEVFFTQAIEDARTIDAEYERTGQSRGALHGLPVSLKDNINLVGMDSSMGFVSCAGKPATDDAEVVTTMRAAGAVFYCKTNVPSGMLMGESYNNIWGFTVNPYNLDYSSGGSSGGESALLALRGSPLGVGSDIGGSIRMPAAICGLYGLKCSSGRFSQLGSVGGLPGQESLRSVIGPMAPDLDSLELWARTALANKPWERDHNTLVMPWKEVEVPKRLCFGIILDDGVVRPTPAVRRVLLDTKAALEAAGHRVVEWTPYDAPLGVDMLLRFLKGDGGKKIHDLITASGEPWPRGLKMFIRRYAETKDATPTVGQLWDLQAERQKYLQAFFAHWLDSKELTGTGRAFDGVIAPTSAWPAPLKYKFRYTGYAGLWNLADQTAVAFPAGRARSSDVKHELEWRNWDEQKIWQEYDAERLDGMPVGLQLITAKHQEELALKLTAVAAEAVRRYGRARM